MATPTIFVKTYTNLDRKAFEKFVTLARMMSDNGIGPKVLKVEKYVQTKDGFGQIIFKEVYSLHEIEEDEELITGTTYVELKAQMKSAVDKMHSLGYAHGDLSDYRWGYDAKKKRMVILSSSYMYPIADGLTEEVQEWMDCGFGWEGTFEEFVKHDYQFTCSPFWRDIEPCDGWDDINNMAQEE